jgi:hypothetical protein
MDIAKVYPGYGKECLKLKNWGEDFPSSLPSLKDSLLKSAPNCQILDTSSTKASYRGKKEWSVKNYS